jgi:hypothetical protein
MMPTIGQRHFCYTFSGMRQPRYQEHPESVSLSKAQIIIDREENVLLGSQVAFRRLDR